MISHVAKKVHKVLKVQRVLRFLECADECWNYHLIRGPLEPWEPFTQKKSSHISLNLTALLKISDQSLAMNPCFYLQSPYMVFTIVISFSKKCKEKAEKTCSSLLFNNAMGLWFTFSDHQSLMSGYESGMGLRFPGRNINPKPQTLHFETQWRKTIK